MCGIAGIVAINGRVEPDVLQQMCDRLAHRGPDGQGFVMAAGAWDRLCFASAETTAELPPGRTWRLGLGHRRLAILDLSDRGRQPMGTRDGRTWIIFNGEIYNHVSLRAELTSKGYEFLTRTDTEVLLNAYVEWGPECVRRLDGMFAFAIWDGRNHLLFCARDRLGIKPFYYATSRDHFVFGSEIKALQAFPDCARAADDRAVLGFLVHGNADCTGRTMFQDVLALDAGHTITVEPSGRTAIDRYWVLGPRRSSSGTDQERIGRLRQLLTATVRSHLISDVRVGSCLSGGLDSSTMVGLIGRIQEEDPPAASAVGEHLHTFTACYEQRRFDERAYALEVANAVGAAPHLVFPSPADFWSDFERIAWHQDMPFGSLSFYAQWRVMRAARDAGVKVLIDGQGGDEVFGGYAKFRYAYLASLLRGRRFGGFTRELAQMIRHGDRHVLDIRNGFRYLPSFIRRALGVDAVLRRVVVADWDTAVADESTPATRWWRYARTGDGRDGWSLVQRIQADDITVDTLPQLLRMEDRSSMAFSIESRVPLLDHRVVEYGVSLPDHLKVHRGYSKFAMREAMRGILPEAVRRRTSKLGFTVPDRRWIAHELRMPIRDLIGGPLRCSRYIDADALRRWHASRGSRMANTMSFVGLFRILSLEMWMRAFGL